MKTAITPELVDYAVRWGARQDDVLARVQRETEALPHAGMLMPPEQGALMTLLARIAGARRALEVGTFTGYGAVSIARGLAEGGTLLCLELSEEYAAVARRNLDAAGVGDRVEIRVGPAADALRALPPEAAFDFAFLDADKEGNPAYYELVLERLEPGGLVLIDNTLMGGRVLDPEGSDLGRSVHDLNSRIAGDERVDAVLVPFADGLTIARKR
ncbi:MAG TPA: O-methyltransferase [Solirubrobacteraceae bacterium]|jgi:caffeoyl-CoA O-methyltransferase